MIAPPPPTVLSALLPPGVTALCRALSGAGAVTDTGKAAKDGDSSRYRAVFHRTRIPAGIFAGQEEKGSTRELREPQRCAWQRGQVSAAKHFVNSGPDSPL